MRSSSLFLGVVAAFAIISLPSSFASEGQHLPSALRSAPTLIDHQALAFAPAPAVFTVAPDFSGIGHRFALVSEARADEALPPALQVPDQDLGTSIGQLLNYKALGAIGVGMVVIVILMQLLKNAFGDFKYKRVVVTGLAVVYAVLLALTAGVGVGPAIVTVLFTGGGASALYDAIKGVTGVARVPA